MFRSPVAIAQDRGHWLTSRTRRSFDIPSVPPVGNAMGGSSVLHFVLDHPRGVSVKASIGSPGFSVPLPVRRMSLPGIPPLHGETLLLSDGRENGARVVQLDVYQRRPSGQTGMLFDG